ncbi:hypothetical protein [Lysobacter sp. GCM10012299]|uniref:hypothetical protein n=1 Tax=Lysobacter sp. GCM10012299 TaxID=3317333 RepID=UPI003623A70C
MSKWLSILLLGVSALAGCDRHMAFSGTVAAQDGQPLRNCTYEFESRGRRVSGAFDAPRFDEGYAVGFRAVTITIACEGYAPVTIKETPGGDLGRIVLAPVAARLPPRQ